MSPYRRTIQQVQGFWYNLRAWAQFGLKGDKWSRYSPETTVHGSILTLQA